MNEKERGKERRIPQIDVVHYGGPRRCGDAIRGSLEVSTKNALRVPERFLENAYVPVFRQAKPLGAIHVIKMSKQKTCPAYSFQVKIN